MKDLEKIIQENKESFDRLTPQLSWADIKKELPNTKPNNVVKLSIKKVLGIAATLLMLIFATTYFVFDSDNNDTFNNLSMQSPQGNFIPLNPSKNKVTLVQFWESGNVVCSDDNCYYYMPAYEKYKTKGFEIYAISLDNDKQTWLNGIEENNLPWIHVSDLQGWNSPICVECNISKVPTSFLLNEKGEIIGKDIVAEDLEDILSKLLVSN